MRATGGICGLYSYARRKGSGRHLLKAKVRELTYGCRSYVLGAHLQGLDWWEYEVDCALPFAERQEPMNECNPTIGDDASVTLPVPVGWLSRMLPKETRAALGSFLDK